MDIQHVCFSKKERITARFLNSWLLFLLIIIPISCTAQKNALTRISSVERSDNKGHVIRFHINKAAPAFELSQPQAELVQFQLIGSGIDTTKIRVDDQSDIIKKVNFYSFTGGIGVDIFLKPGSFYKAVAYPDRASEDLLLALAKTTRENLETHINDMESFAWSKANVNNAALAENEPKTNESAVDTSYQRVKDKIKFDTVVLDAGHGGKDVGTNHNGVYEKDVVLAITKKVGGYINKYLPDVKVVYTRDDDTLIDLYERGPIANRAEGDLFVSIHANAVPSAPRAYGTETYFLGLERSESALKIMERENKVVNPDGNNTTLKISQEELFIYELANSGYISNSQKLAGMVEEQFEKRAGRRSRGVKQNRFVVLYQASMPAILVETGFISNPSEAKYLTSDYGQSIIASAIYRAIRNYKEQFEKSQHFNTN